VYVTKNKYSMHNAGADPGGGGAPGTGPP